MPTLRNQANARVELNTLLLPGPLATPPSQGRRLNFVPRHTIVRIRHLIGQPAMKLKSLRFGEGGSRLLGAYAIEDLLRERDPLADGHAVDTELA